MATSEGKLDSSARIQIIVAVIGLLGVVATAVISNWSSIFPKPAPTQQTTSNTSPTPVQKKTERPVYSSGQLVVRGTWLCDLDAGAEDQNGDFKWDQQTNVERYLTPESGAVFFVVGIRDFDSLKYAELERLQYSPERIEANDAPNNNIPQGTVVAYRTKQGRLGKFVVVAYGYNLTIRWITYQK
ncbi:MAG: hypothetical protein WBE38_17310 [Terracidiphilus sp.]|jgi:hypothetical protein